MNKRSDDRPHDRERRKTSDEHAQRAEHIRAEHVEHVELAVIPVVQESLTVGKREVETGKVTVEIVPRAQTKVIDVPLEAEEVIVERVPVNRIVEQAQPPREEGETTIMPVYEEVLVVEKRLMLKEEVRISRRKRTLRGRHEAELRSEEVEVRRSSAGEPRG